VEVVVSRRRVLHLLISLAFLCGFWVAAGVARATGRQRLRRRGCVVLYYHDLDADEAPRFARQMDLLTRTCRPLSLDADPAGLDGGRYAAVSFDDALRGVAEVAAPVLVSRNIPFTVFAPSACLGRPVDWIPDGDHDGGSVLSPEELRDLAPGLCTVGSHTRHHVRLTATSRAEALEELVGSRRELQDLMGRPADLVAFPYGSYNEEVLEWCREAGYRRAFGVLPRPPLGAGEFLVGRLAASPRDTDLEFRLKLLGAYDWLPRASALKRRFRFGRRKATV
jgi:peptidoglycan/xylan/chitin deacetylase (PgdA/CDA1 family)